MEYNSSRMTPPPFYSGQEVVAQTNAVMKGVYVRMFIFLMVSVFCAFGVVSTPTVLTFFFVK